MKDNLLDKDDICFDKELGKGRIVYVDVDNQCYTIKFDKQTSILPFYEIDKNFRKASLKKPWHKKDSTHHFIRFFLLYLLLFFTVYFLLLIPILKLKIVWIVLYGVAGFLIFSILMIAYRKYYLNHFDPRKYKKGARRFL